MSRAPGSAASRCSTGRLPGPLRAAPGRADARMTCFPFRLPTPGTDVLSFKTASGANIIAQADGRPLRTVKGPHRLQTLSLTLTLICG